MRLTAVRMCSYWKKYIQRLVQENNQTTYYWSHQRGWLPKLHEDKKPFIHSQYLPDSQKSQKLQEKSMESLNVSWYPIKEWKIYIGDRVSMYK